MVKDVFCLPKKVRLKGVRVGAVRMRILYLSAITGEGRPIDKVINIGYTYT
jgi:hypothetical protein